MNKEHIGSNFDDFLKEEGILEEVDFVNSFAIALTNTNIYEREEIGKKIFKQLKRLKAENESRGVDNGMLAIKDIENQIINADCMDILKQLPDKCVDLVLTDPPYGIGIDGQKERVCTNPKHNRKLHIQKDWDKEIPKKEFFNQIRRVAKNIIVCGANYFNEFLEQGKKGWIIWDKGQRGLTMSDCEIFYSNFDKPTRIYTVNRCELIKDFTFHPTQKPLKLFEMILRDYSNENDLVLDCFSGSGTTAIACYNTRRNFICIEKDTDYYTASVERLKNAQAQMRLF